jgi:hypothetical protein
MSETSTEQAKPGSGPDRGKAATPPAAPPATPPAASPDPAPEGPQEFTISKLVQRAESLLEVSPHVVVAALHDVEADATLTLDDAKQRVEGYLEHVEVRDGREPQPEQGASS